MNAIQILNLLAEKHSEDIFIPECKDGPSGGGHSILDAWTMNRSWSNLTMTGYEIKVSRSDFVGDEKWHGYLQYCHKFFFVAPPGIIGKNELPAEVGLIETSKTGNRVFIKKQAPHRDIELPGMLMAYILMCRVKTVKKSTYGWPDPEDPDRKLREWKNWLAAEADVESIGHLVSKKIQQRIAVEIKKVKEENVRIKRENDNCQVIREFLTELGVKDFSDSYNIKYNLEKRMEKLKIKPPDDLEIDVKRLIGNLQEFQKTIGGGKAK